MDFYVTSESAVKTKIFHLQRKIDKFGHVEKFQERRGTRNKTFIDVQLEEKGNGNLVRLVL